MSGILLTTPRRVLSMPLLVAVGLAGLLACGIFAAGRATAPQAASRVDCLEVRLVPDEQGDGLRVRAYLYDGDGHQVWTRDLDQQEPLAVLWDQTEEGQDAVDLSHWQAEQEVKP